MIISEKTSTRPLKVQVHAMEIILEAYQSSEANRTKKLKTRF
jgi:hypothetical protein